jgi:hypothetical protein
MGDRKERSFLLLPITHYLSPLLRFLLDLHYFPAFVKAALGTDAMRHPRLLTVGANRGLRGAQRVVRAAFARTRF